MNSKPYVQSSQLNVFRLLLIMVFRCCVSFPRVSWLMVRVWSLEMTGLGTTCAVGADEPRESQRIPRPPPPLGLTFGSDEGFSIGKPHLGHCGQSGNGEQLLLHALLPAIHARNGRREMKRGAGQGVMHRRCISISPRGTRPKASC